MTSDIKQSIDTDKVFIQEINITHGCSISMTWGHNGVIKYGYRVHKSSEYSLYMTLRHTGTINYGYRVNMKTPYRSLRINREYIF